MGGEVLATAQVSAFVGRLNMEGDVIPEDSLGVVAGLGNGVGMGGGQRRGGNHVICVESRSLIFPVHGSCTIPDNCWENWEV